jgi:hypothetical protein
MVQDLKKKEKFREKFAVKDEWVLPFEVVPIINIPGFGDKAAVKVSCLSLHILCCFLLAPQHDRTAQMRFPQK